MSKFEDFTEQIFPQVFEFLKRKDFVVDLLKHIGTSAISDLVLRLITCVDGTDIKQGWVRVSVELFVFWPDSIKFGLLFRSVLFYHFCPIT